MQFYALDWMLLAKIQIKTRYFVACRSLCGLYRPTVASYKAIVLSQIGLYQTSLPVWCYPLVCHFEYTFSRQVLIKAGSDAPTFLYKQITKLDASQSLT